MRNVFVLGSLNMDLFMLAPTLPKQGETVRGEGFRHSPGGKGLNQAIACAKLGANVKMLGAIGDDPFGKELLLSLESNKVDASNIRIRKGVPSGVAIILLHEDDNRILIEKGANFALSKEDVDAFLEEAKEGDIFLTQLENDIDLVCYALKEAKSKEMLTICNPAPCDKAILNAASSIDILTPNEGELLTLLDNAKFPYELGIPYVIETRGKDGYYLYSSKKEDIHEVAMEVKVVDTTGAGDTYNGALAYRLALGKELDKETLDFSCFAASFSTTRVGASISSPTLEELEVFLNKANK